MNEQQRGAVQDAIQARMASFEQAERALDAPRLLGHFSEDGDFYMHNDGHRVALGSMSAAVSEAFATLRSIEGGFTGLEIQVLAADAAFVTARFHETVTTGDGTMLQQRGAATWLWRLRRGEWKITYGHVDHYADAL